MQVASLSLFSKENVKSYIFDLLALGVIYFLPAFSHLFSFPLYLLEPMRIMVVLSVIFTDRKNAYLIAITLPVFSFLVSAHPSILKSLLITIELVANVWLFFSLKGVIENSFVRMIAAISGSKVLYYALKIFVLYSGFMAGDVIATPIYMQLIVTALLGGIIYFFSLRGKNVQKN